ncbi:GNAT family protein [Nonomuraea longicatena]|uniref:GNAT family protein n=1 Tax=Nonomuraea longicatena TaxID=83682 RepID=A0ABP3Z1Q3_9ACTN
MAAVREAAADPYIPLVTSVPVPYTHAEGLAFVARQHDRAARGVGYSFAVADGRAVGQIGLWPARDGGAVIGYWVVRSARGRGVAGRALAAVAGWGLDVLRLDLLTLRVEPWNEPSIRAATRVGFERSGSVSMEVGGVDREMWVYTLLP